MGTLPDSLHLPTSSSFTAADAGFSGEEDHHQFSSEPSPPPRQLTADALDQRTLRLKGRPRETLVLCVIGGGGAKGAEEAQEAATRLLRLGHSRLCVLHGGADVFKPMAGVLCLPDT